LLRVVRKLFSLEEFSTSARRVCDNLSPVG